MTLIQRDTRAREPWTDFADVPATLNQPFSAFPHNYAQLPALSFVIPNLQDSMHSGTVARGDHWLGTHIAAYDLGTQPRKLVGDYLGRGQSHGE